MPPQPVLYAYFRYLGIAYPCRTFLSIWAKGEFFQAHSIALTGGFNSRIRKHNRFKGDDIRFKHFVKVAVTKVTAYGTNAKTRPRKNLYSSFLY